MTIRILTGDCRDVLQTLPDESVHAVVTSPPYYSLRDYGTGTWAGGDATCTHQVSEIRTGQGMAALGAQYRGGGHKAAAAKPIYAHRTCPLCGAERTDRQIGLEETPEDYIATMVSVFREVKRILRKDGTCWINIGDTYASDGGRGAGGNYGRENRSWQQENPRAGRGRHTLTVKPKDLYGIPWMLAFALRADGWYLRQEIIWSKPNPMPESTRDRCTKAHESLFLLSKSERYYFNQAAIAEPASENTHARISQDVAAQRGSDRANAGVRRTKPMKAVRNNGVGFGRGYDAVTKPQYRTPSGWEVASGRDHHALKGRYNGAGPKAVKDSVGVGWRSRQNESFQTAISGSVLTMRNKRSVWEIPTAPFKGAHFATFPPALVLPCVLAGCPEGGMILDPFGGSGTVGLVADRHHRDAVLIELKAEYSEMARQRVTAESPLLTEASVE